MLVTGSIEWNKKHSEKGRNQEPKKENEEKIMQERKTPK